MEIVTVDLDELSTAAADEVRAQVAHHRAQRAELQRAAARDIVRDTARRVQPLDVQLEAVDDDGVHTVVPATVTK